MAIWSEAPIEVIHMAQELIDKHHPDLKSANIGFVFRDVNGTSRNRAVLATCQKVQASLKPYLQFDFIIWISEEAWTVFSDKQRHALIDHELCHARTDEDEQPVLIGHDIEEFRVIIERYGYWKEDLLWLGELANSEKALQMALDWVAEQLAEPDIDGDSVPLGPMARGKA